MKLIYCAIPSRMSKILSKEINLFVMSFSEFPFNPFMAFPLELYENGPMGREKTLDYCKKFVEICDEFWLFGLSEGTIEELERAISANKKIKTFSNFDKEWFNEKNKLINKIDVLIGMKKFDTFISEKSSNQK